MNTTLHVLHIDDSAFDRQLVRDALEHESDQFKVTEAASRQEFEARLAVGGYDLVLTDFNILGFQGLQVIEAVHKQNAAVPVIVVTGTGSEEIAVEAMKRGAADYVLKTPLHIRRLPMAIQAAMERKQLQDEYVQSEQALRSSEARLRAFAKALPDLAFIMDEDGRYVHFLNAPENLLYLPAECQLGKRVHEVLPLDIAEKIMDAIRRTIETTLPQMVEYQLELATGLTWFEGRFSLMANPPGEKALIVCVARDITDSKQAELRLARERNLLRTLIDHVPDYIFVKDRQGQFIASNTAHAALAHLLPGQVIGKTASAIFLPDTSQRFHADDEMVMTTDKALISEERIILDIDGIQRWVLMTKVPLHNENGAVIGLAGVARDITARKQAEEALRASEEHLRAVISGTPVILYVLDMEGRLTLLQGQGLDVFGGDANEYIGKSVLEIFSELIPDIQERFQRALTGEESSSVLMIGDVVLDVRYSPLRYANGESRGVIGVATDITERLKAEKLRIELEKEQEMIALKERFIATASHDFRTPLTIIRMSVNMLETYLDRMSLEQRSAKLQQIGTQVDYMVQLLDDVLTMSKANAGKLDFKPEPVVLRSFCEQIWNDYQHMAEKTHTIDFVYHCHQERVRLDPNLIHYVLANLLSNAIKYSFPGGVIHFGVEQANDYLVFGVSDNGMGIPEQEQSKLFEPFYRATNAKGIDGTGLGLSIVQSYVKTHGGRIEFNSQEGKGTTFTVYIPCIPG